MDSKTTDEKETKEKVKDQNEKQIKTYLLGIFVIFVLVLISFIFVPRGGALQRCLGSFFQTSKYECIGQLAQSTMNESLCVYLPNDSKTLCYTSIAQNKSNARICNNIQDTANKSYCVQNVANVSSNSSLCFTLSGQYKNSCLEYMALRLKNAALCNSISDSTQNVICSSSVNFKDALSSKNPSYCSNVSQRTDNGLEYLILENGTVGNENATAFVQHLVGYLSIGQNYNISGHDLCYMSLAYVTSSSSSCSSIKDTNTSSLCDAIALSNVNKTYSYNTTTFQNYTQLLNVCYNTTNNYTECNATNGIEKAVATKNATACKKYPEPYYDNCYSYIAQAKDNESFCAYIKNSSQATACTYFFTYGNLTNGG